jgi:CarD family transcriptional regulator
MNLDGLSKSENSDLRSTSIDQSLSETNEGRRRDKRFGYKAGDFVVYPSHGVGEITAIEEQTVAGAILELFIIYFAKSKMTLRLPTRKVSSVGLRKLSSPGTVQLARLTLGQTAKKARGSWSRLAQEYESKINSGDIIAIAEVVRDLYQPRESEQSYRDRQLYLSALERLSAEVALVTGITEDKAMRELEGAVSGR